MTAAILQFTADEYSHQCGKLDGRLRSISREFSPYPTDETALITKAEDTDFSS